MPFGSYEASKEQAFSNAAILMKETNCSAVKLEGGVEVCETVHALTSASIPVMGHIGLKPQSVHADGGYRTHGQSQEEKDKILADAMALQNAGAFAIVAECVTKDIARQLVQNINVPIIGIGSSWECDGQIIVTEDLLGLTYGRIPSFVPQKAELGNDVVNGVKAYKEDIVANYKVPLKSVA
jgi:3-methyl-2-oxobutanoate hydroxymethyltransferase